MKLFLKKLGLFFLIGFILISLLFLSYLYTDPFKVVGEYTDYSYPSVALNRDYISSEMFIKNHQKYNYNSFIFGSSRTLAFKPSSWSSYLEQTNVPYMLDSSGESIYGIYKKIKYLDSHGVKIKNALIVIDRDCTFQNNSNPSTHLEIKHPSFTGESEFAFQSTFFKAYLNPVFIFDYYYFLSFKKYRQFMKGYIEPRKIKFDTITNELSIIDQEIELAENPIQYYKEKESQFYERYGESVDPINRIDKKSLNMLLEIKQILVNQETKYKVIISPLYEQIKINEYDLQILKDIFGKTIYDFSGKNIFTDDRTNYYEKSHYRPIVGESILKIIYK